ncbi:hypothetical protein DIPPA_27400 [Diplonema papillatum]|nr:hypothetical protein DIPPA_27400 [Diplonema papillatum]
MHLAKLESEAAQCHNPVRSALRLTVSTSLRSAANQRERQEAQRVSIAALQEAVALRDQQINDLETEVTTRDAAGIASDGALSGDLQTCRFASPPADDAHAFDRLLNGSRALLARLQRKLMAAGEDAVRHYGGALAATAHPQAFALQPGGSREGPGNRGVTTLKGKRQTEARREKELDSLRRFSAFLDRLVDVRGLLSGRYVPADVLDSAARHITVAQLGLSGQAPVAPAMHATMSAESIEDAAKQLRYAALFTHHLASTFAEAVRMLFTPKNTRASVANEKEASGGGAQGKPTPPSASLAAVDLFNLPPVTANTAQDVTERISKAETVFLAGFSAKGGAAACAGIVEPRQAGAGPGPGGEWCALPTVLPHRKGYLSTLQLMSRNAAMKPARDTLLEQVGGWTIARLLQKDAADTPVSVQVIVHVAVCLVTGRVPKVENLSHLAALPIPTIEEDLANPQTPGTDHGGDAAPGARTANPPSANLEGASAASMKRPSRALSSHNNSGNANNNPAAAKKEKLRAKSRKGRGASHAKLSNAIALEAEETDLSAMVRMDSTGSDDAHDDKPAPARRLSGLAINVRALSMVSSTGTQSAPATPGPLSPSRWSVPWGETQLQLGDLAERLVPLAAALDPLDLGPAQQAAVLGVSAYLVSHGPTVPRYAEPVRGWILALAACLERKDEAAYHCEYWPRDAPQSLQESSMAAVPPDKVVEAPVSTICGSTVGHLAATFMFLVRQERSAAARQQRCTCQGAPGARRQNHPGVADKNPASKSEK